MVLSAQIQKMEISLWSLLPLRHELISLQPDSSPPKCSNFQSFEIVIIAAKFAVTRRLSSLHFHIMKLENFLTWLVIFVAALVCMVVAFELGYPEVGGPVAGFGFVWLGVLWHHIVDSKKQSEKDLREEHIRLLTKMREGLNELDQMKDGMILEEMCKVTFEE